MTGTSVGEAGTRLRHGRAMPEGHTTSTSWLTDAEQRSWRAFLAAGRLLEAALEDDVQAYGITLGEYEILALLSEAKGSRARMSVLADRVVASRSRLTHTASRLERRGLVERHRAADDRRGVDLVLTPEGGALLDVVAPHHVAGVRRHFIDHLGPEGADAFGRLMARVRDGIRAENDPDAPHLTA